MEEVFGRLIVDSALRVHSALGPGLLESAYEACLAYELRTHLPVQRQMVLPVVYDGISMDAGYRTDLLVGERVVVELKAVEKVSNLHFAQVLSYLKLGGYRLGFLLNFNVVHMKHAIRRVANGL